MAPSMGNLTTINHSILALLKNTSIFVKAVCLLVVLGYGLSFLEMTESALSVTPGYLLPPRFWVWTAFTHCFLEVRLWQVCVDIVTLGLCGKLVEPLWGSFEMVFFFLMVNILVAFLSAFYYLILYMFVFNPAMLFEVHIHGMAGYIAGLSVAVKQAMPDHVLIHTRTPLGKITNRHVPILLLVMSVLLYLWNILEGQYATMILSGIGVSWVYLRFYQVHSNGSRGDMADSFNFSSFFPTVLQPPIQLLGDKLFSCLVAIKICRKVVRKYDVGAPSSISISLPGVNSSDAERRRQKALKLLTERLDQQQSQTQEEWPLLENNSEDQTKENNPSPVPAVHSMQVEAQTSDLTSQSKNITGTTQAETFHNDQSPGIASTIVQVDEETPTS